MRPFWAFIFTLMIGCFLLWLYCVVRVFLGDFPFDDEFIIGIPITFLHLSMASFIIFLTALFLFLCRDVEGDNFW